MKIILLSALVSVALVHSATVSILTDEVSNNNTSPTIKDISAKTVDVFRQLLNQETIIRMTLVKNVHTLMKDMLMLQENLTKAENIQTSTDREISELKKQVTSLKKENDALKNKNVDYENEVIYLKGNLKNVTDILVDTKVEVRYLSITLFGMDSHSKDVDDEVQELKNWTRKIESKMTENALDYTETISELETRHLKYIGDVNTTTNSVKADFDKYEVNQLKISAAVSSLELFRMNQTMSSCALNVSTKIGFTASVSSASSSWNSGTLVFPKVITNVGKGYNPSDGIFTAPIAGVYVFFVNVQSYASQSMHVDMVLNGITKVRTLAYNGGSETHEAGPNLAVLTLQIGDRVWIKHYSGQGYYTHTDGPMTTFSGFKI